MVVIIDPRIERSGHNTELYIYAGVSLAGVSCRRHWPPPTTLALTTLLG